MSTVWVLDEDDALELLAYLITAARTQVDEAAEYGPTRLLTAAHRLGEMVVARASEATGALVYGAGSVGRSPLPRVGDAARSPTLLAAIGAARRDCDRCCCERACPVSVGERQNQVDRLGVE